MNLKRVNILAALALAVTMVVAGCKSTPPPAAGVKNPDGSTTNPDGSVTYPAGTQPPTTTVTKNPDGSITNADGSVTYPAGVKPPQAASAPAPVQEATQPAAPAPEAKPKPPVAKTAPEGTPVVTTITETLAASKNDVGDGFSGVLAEPIVTSGGATVFPKGTRVAGQVVAAKGRGKFKGAGDLGIALTSIGGVKVSTTTFEKTEKGKGKRTAGMIGGGTGVGALIGGLAGGGKGAAIGAIAGAGAGTAASAYTGNKDVVIPSESRVTFTLTAPVSAR
jgi:hypothetical protein